MKTSPPTPILVFQSRFRLGGQERQTVLHLRTLDRSRWEPVLACLHLDGDHLADVRALGLTPHLFDAGRHMPRPGTFWQVFRLAHLLKRKRIALLHAQDLYTNVLGLIAARPLRIPAIVTRVDLAHAVEGYRRPLLALASRVADRVLVNAQCIRDLCIRDGVDPSRIVVVRNGVDLTAFDQAASRAPARPAPDLSRPSAMMVANMNHPVKGHADALVAWRQVLKQVPDARLLFVGDGPLRPVLERQAREMGIAEHCGFLGHRLDVPALVARAACLLSASYAEGISNAVLEAMAARLAVVATSAGGTPELVRDGVNGFLVPPGAPTRLAAALCTLLHDRALARRMGEEGRRVVEDEFGVEHMRRAYDALYEELCGEGGLSRLARAG